MPLGAEPLSPSPRLQIKAQGPVPHENHLGCGWKTRKTSLKEGSSAPQNKKVPLPCSALLKIFNMFESPCPQLHESTRASNLSLMPRVLLLVVTRSGSTTVAIVGSRVQALSSRHKSDSHRVSNSVKGMQESLALLYTQTRMG